MPLWNIYHTAGVFETQEIRKNLAADITKLYTVSGLPGFYVVIQFIPLPASNVFVAAEARTEKPFVRLTVEHMAVHRHEGAEGFPARFSDAIDATLKPYIADQGYDWEITVTDTTRDFWRLNGLAAPPWRSEAEKMWAKEGRPLPWSRKSKA